MTIKNLHAEERRLSAYYRNNFGRVPISDRESPGFVKDPRKYVNPGNSRKIKRVET